jgi:hypothetical protein
MSKENLPHDQIFDSSQKLKKIIRLPQTERRSALTEFKNKFALQQKLLALMQLEIRDILVQDYSESNLKNINNLLNQTFQKTETSGVGLPPQIKNQLNQIFSHLSDLSAFIDLNHKSFQTKKADLISILTDVEEQAIAPHLDKIKIKTSPVSLDLICADDQSYQILSERKDDNENGISFVLSNQKFQFSVTIIKLNPLSNSFESTLKHERSHAVDHFLRAHFTTIDYHLTDAQEKEELKIALNALTLAEEKVKTEIMSFIYAESNIEIYKDLPALIISIIHRHLADNGGYNVFLQDENLQRVLSQATNPQLKNKIWQKYCHDVTSTVFALCIGNNHDQKLTPVLLQHLINSPLNLWLKETIRFFGFSSSKVLAEFKKNKNVLLKDISPTAPELAPTNPPSNTFPND